jgi:hypothetical protein
MYKPDPGLFTKALGLIGVDPAEVLYVGDTPEEDVLGAKLAGMRVAWVNRGKAWKDSLPAPDYEIDKLTDLISILDGSAGEALPGRGCPRAPTYPGGEAPGPLKNALLILDSGPTRPGRGVGCPHLQNTRVGRSRGHLRTYS